MTAHARPFGRLDHAGAVTRLRAHHALYSAARAVDAAACPVESPAVSNSIAQSGAEVARALRARFIAHSQAVVVDAAGRFQDPSDRS
jgi:hypothetical protein